MNSSVTSYYRCPDRYVRFMPGEVSSAVSGYFRVGPGAIVYGNCSGHPPADSPTEALHDALLDVVIKDGTIYLPFDPSQLVANLCRELYVGDWRHGSSSFVSRMYYLLRPALSIGVRKRLQKLYLRGWDKLSFPRWPVDCSQDNLQEQLMLLSLRAGGVKRVPFIWFWPEGHSSCAIMTHDVETGFGRDLCGALMDVDDSFGIKASLQIVPEERYTVSPEFLQSIRARGFEVVVHDLNHDGHLYRDREQFLRRAAKINSYGKQYGADGFRAGVLYRKQVWYEALKFAFDMSVPNVARLDPQRGGCCTVMPFFLGDILELPVTTIQDYTLFNILNDFSINIWKRQIEIIMGKHGFMSFIVHPDYIMKPRELKVYRTLLDHLSRLRQEKAVWITTPGEVNRWWRQRAGMQLVEDGDGWRIEGDGAERACVAWASEKEGHLAFALQEGRAAAGARQGRSL